MVEAKKHRGLIVTVSIIALFVGCLLPIIGILVEQVQVVINGAKVYIPNEETGLILGSTNQIFKNIIDFYQKSFSGKSTNVSATSMMQYSVFMSIFTVTAIVGLVNIIILFVNSLKRIVNAESDASLSRPLLSLASAIAVYVAVLLGLVYYQGPCTKILTGDKLITIGAGPVILLVSAGVDVVLCIMLHCACESEKPASSRLFHVFVGVFSFVGTILLFLTPTYFSIGNTTTSQGLIKTVLAMFGYLIEGASPAGVVFLYLAIIGLAFFCVALGFVSKLGVLALGTYTKKTDYEKSCIVRSSIFLGFVIMGSIFYHFAVESFMLTTVSTSAVVSIGAPMIVCYIIAALCLAFSIAAKAISSSKESKKEEKK